MNERIPIFYDRSLRPEWIDFALEQYLKARDEASLKRSLEEYLRPMLHEKVTLRKTVAQLQRCAGFKSTIPRDRLKDIHRRMVSLAPDERRALRLQLLVESNPFFADCVGAIQKLHTLGEDSVQLQQMYERITAKYGERGSVPRRVRYVLQTLALLGVLVNRDKRWYLVK